ncbi:hypothetical protein AGIG_G13734 [Arapaima gigas]
MPHCMQNYFIATEKGHRLLGVLAWKHRLSQTSQDYSFNEVLDLLLKFYLRFLTISRSFHVRGPFEGWKELGCCSLSKRPDALLR